MGLLLHRFRWSLDVSGCFVLAALSFPVSGGARCFLGA